MKSETLTKTDNFRNGSNQTTKKSTTKEQFQSVTLGMFRAEKADINDIMTRGEAAESQSFVTIKSNLTPTFVPAVTRESEKTFHRLGAAPQSITTSPLDFGTRLSLG